MGRGGSGWFGVLLGLVAIGFSVHGVLTGEVRVVWGRLRGMGSLASTFSREDSPVMFWAATSFYGLVGLLMAGAGIHSVLGH